MGCAEEGRKGSRRVEKMFTKCTSCGGRRPKYVKTGYGNWIKWRPPKPLNNVKTKPDGAEKRKKALKAEKAQVQLKRQVKALTAKNEERWRGCGSSRRWRSRRRSNR